MKRVPNRNVRSQLQKRCPAHMSKFQCEVWAVSKLLQLNRLSNKELINLYMRAPQGSALQKVLTNQLGASWNKVRANSQRKMR